MKKQIILSVLIFLSSVCFGENVPLFYFCPYTGYASCKTDEIIYEEDNTYRSLLEWEEKHLITTGLLFITKFETLSFDIFFDYSFPLAQRQMCDRDWDYSELYSITTHPIKKQQLINSGLGIEWFITQKGIFTLNGCTQILYNYSNYNSDNGTGTRRNKPISVYSIDYKKHSLFTLAGLNAQFEPFSHFFVDAGFLISPFCLQYGYDHHHGIKHPWASKDLETGFFSKFKANAGCRYEFSEHFSLGLEFDILFGFADKGTLYEQMSDNTFADLGEKSGANQKWKSITLYLSYHP